MGLADAAKRGEDSNPTIRIIASAAWKITPFRLWGTSTENGRWIDPVGRGKIQRVREAESHRQNAENGQGGELDGVQDNAGGRCSGNAAQG